MWNRVYIGLHLHNIDFYMKVNAAVCIPKILNIISYFEETIEGARGILPYIGVCKICNTLYKNRIGRLIFQIVLMHIATILVCITAVQLEF